MSRASKLAMVTLVGYLAVSLTASSVQARPNYFKEFSDLYPGNAAAAAAKCGVCHGSDKKIRNNYGMAVGAALGGTKVTGAKVKTAIEDAATKPSATEGKSFGDLIKAGMLPGK